MASDAKIVPKSTPGSPRNDTGDFACGKIAFANTSQVNTYPVNNHLLTTCLLTKKKMMESFLALRRMKLRYNPARTGWGGRAGRLPARTQRGRACLPEL
jgi:hypothetical protein